MQLKISCGYDGISSRLLKLVKPVVIKSLTLIINQILGIFPDKLKIAKVISIFKKGDHTQVSNYRLISLLPVTSKVVETIIYTQLDSLFKTPKISCLKTNVDLEWNIALNWLPLN